MRRGFAGSHASRESDAMSVTSPGMIATVPPAATLGRVAEGGSELADFALQGVAHEK